MYYNKLDYNWGPRGVSSRCLEDDRAVLIGKIEKVRPSGHKTERADEAPVMKLHFKSS